MHRKRGPTMKIEFELSDDEINASRLIKAFKCDDAQLREKIGDFAKAACVEYVNMAEGTKVFTRFSDLQEYRLYLLVKYFFSGNIPGEQTICSLLKIQYGSARGLIRSMLSRYRSDIEECVEANCIHLLKSCKKIDTNDGAYRIVAIESSNLASELNDVLASIGSDQAPLKKMPNTMSNYRIEENSYRELCKRFGVDG